ncbi:hypothetical protein EAH89_09655 [Roseomonas nepalensis]|uniref:Uncharacterized protein n=1 Tax=Muricoccus nepalensis TaxID=1854500 RepID=A0A502G755_9PROT|nr:hypothetical protein [Roseomonas nepalensis]TPG57688.1 hypothetical protein EAH89_09655 [Roseomonas nepalensis]
MPATGFSASHALFMVLAGALALLGVLATARAADLGFAVFGAALIVFGLGFGFWMLKRGLDAWERARH